jgi:hypothetical protein
MTVIDLDEKVAKWFEMEGGGRVQLQSVSADAFKAIQKQTVKKKVDFKKVDGTPGRFEFEEVNTELQNELFWDAVIIGWENLSDKNGKDIPCTKENKVLLMTRSAKFAKFVADGLKVLGEDETKAAEQAEKN